MKNFFQENKLLITVLLISFLTIFITGLFFYFEEKKPGKYDDFALCLKEKKVKFYGAFWCPHCQNQKKLFGKSEKYLPYIECSTIDGQGQLEICQKAKIKSYPTWEFTDGKRLTGEISLEELSKRSGCQLSKNK